MKKNIMLFEEFNNFDPFIGSGFNSREDYQNSIEGKAQKWWKKNPDKNNGMNSYWFALEGFKAGYQKCLDDKKID